MAFYRCDRGLGFDISNSTGDSKDVIYDKKFNNKLGKMNGNISNPKLYLSSAPFPSVLINDTDYKLFEDIQNWGGEMPVVIPNDIIVPHQPNSNDVRKNVDIYGTTGMRNFISFDPILTSIPIKARLGMNGYNISSYNNIFNYSWGDSAVVLEEGMICLLSEAGNVYNTISLNSIHDRLYNLYYQKYIDEFNEYCKTTDIRTKIASKEVYDAAFEGIDYDYDDYKVIIKNPTLLLDNELDTGIYYTNFPFILLYISVLEADYCVVTKIIFKNNKNQQYDCVYSYTSGSYSGIKLYFWIRINEDKTNIELYPESIYVSKASKYSNRKTKGVLIDTYLYLHPDSKYLIKYNIKNNSEIIRIYSPTSYDYLVNSCFYKDNYIWVITIYSISKYDQNLNQISYENIKCDTTYSDITKKYNYLSSKDNSNLTRNASFIKYINDQLILMGTFSLDKYRVDLNYHNYTEYAIFGNMYFNSIFRYGEDKVFSYYPSNIIYSNPRYYSSYIGDNIWIDNIGYTELKSNIKITSKDLLNVYKFPYNVSEIKLIWNYNYRLLIAHSDKLDLFYLPKYVSYLLNDYDTNYSGYNIDSSNESYTDYYFN